MNTIELLPNTNLKKYTFSDYKYSRFFFRKEEAKKINKITVSDNTIANRNLRLSHDMKNQLKTKVKKSTFFSI